MSKWNIESMAGYKPATDIWDYLTEKGDNITVQDVEKWTVDHNARANIGVWTEAVMALNWKIWEHHDLGNDATARKYDELWKYYDALTFKIWKGDDLSYYIRTTD